MEGAVSPYNQSLSTDLCNSYCAGSEENGKFHREEVPLLQFLSDIGEGSSGREFPRPKSPCEGHS